ncbi:uncharacterized protein TNCV_491771 [Trichonephila clavipes]|nr:uncharacterized protein TNCV_491771 [Trichonephila clavipes]
MVKRRGRHLSWHPLLTTTPHQREDVSALDIAALHSGSLVIPLKTVGKYFNGQDFHIDEFSFNVTAGNITDYVLKQQIKTEEQNNMNEGQDNIKKSQDNMEEIQDSMEEAQSNMQMTEEKMEDTHTNDVIPSEEHNHILNRAMTEALPTSNNDNSAHHDESEKQDKRLTDTVDQHSFEENTTSQLLSEKRQKSHPQDWSANNNKEQREKREPFFGKKKIDGKWSFVEPKSERKIKGRCNCKLSLKDNTKLQCEKLPEEERQKCFKKFWGMS